MKKILKRNNDYFGSGSAFGSFINSGSTNTGIVPTKKPCFSVILIGFPSQVLGFIDHIIVNCYCHCSANKMTKVLLHLFMLYNVFSVFQFGCRWHFKANTDNYIQKTHSAIICHMHVEIICSIHIHIKSIKWYIRFCRFCHKLRFKHLEKNGCICDAFKFQVCADKKIIL